MQKIGIIVKDLSLTNNTYEIFKGIEKMYRDDKHLVNINIFCVDLTKRNIFTRCPVFSIGELFGFDGTCISIGSDMFSYSLNNLAGKEHYLYISDMEWVANGYFRYDDKMNIYHDKHLKDIFMDSDTYIRYFTNNFNRIPQKVDSFGDILCKLTN
jgi:hypothetical protein